MHEEQNRRDWRDTAGATAEPWHCSVRTALCGARIRPLIVPVIQAHVTTGGRETAACFVRPSPLL